MLENADPQKSVKAGYRMPNPDGSHPLLSFRFISNIICTEVKDKGESWSAFRPVQFKIIKNPIRS